MPQRRSGIKELRKTNKRRLHNLDIKTDLKKTVKSFNAAVEQKDKAAVEDQLKSVHKKIDKAAKRNLIHKNTAARRKSKISRIAKAV